MISKPANNSLQRTALRAAAELSRWAPHIMRAKKTFLILSILLLIVFIPIGRQLYITYFTERGRYFRNLALMGRIRKTLTTKKEQAGIYPSAMKALSKDLWGNNFMYYSNGKNFLLISYGRDLKPGGGLRFDSKDAQQVLSSYQTNPSRYLDDADSGELYRHGESWCIDDYAVDLVMSQNGFIQKCG